MICELCLKKDRVPTTSHIYSKESINCRNQNMKKWQQPSQTAYKVYLNDCFQVIFSIKSQLLPAHFCFFSLFLSLKQKLT